MLPESAGLVILDGVPSFLGAYNAGPARFDEVLAERRPLPDETRRFLAEVAARIGFVEPSISGTFAGFTSIARSSGLFGEASSVARSPSDMPSWRSLFVPLGQRSDSR